MIMLRRNSPSRGQPDYMDAVRKWQFFLIGHGFNEPVVDGRRQALVADGDFGAISAKATMDFQAASGLNPDGVVGNDTYGKAMQLGLPMIEDDTPNAVQDSNPNWPPRPTTLSFPSAAQQRDFFGQFNYVSTPRPDNPEAIRITDGWDKANIVRVAVPQLIGVNGAPGTGEVYFHRKVAPAAVALFHAWDNAGLMDCVLSWGGSWVPRFIRGSKTELSNHAYGAAFDINAAWNGLGRQPALVGMRGSVRELVPLANQHGFWWGGHYKTRLDGMHFEFVDFSAG